MNQRTTLALFFAACFFALGLMAGWHWRVSAQPEYDSTERLANFLNGNISNGMSLDEIRDSFGINGAFLNPDYPKSNVQQAILNLYRSRPDGLNETDTFASFAVGDELVLFQLRDGRVINWDTDIFMTGIAG